MIGSASYEFSVAEQDILNIVNLNSYYRGEKIKESQGIHAARMQSGADNADVLKNELKHAADDVVTLITMYLGQCSCSYSDSKYKFSCNGASGFPNGTLNIPVANVIKSYMAHKALEGWLLINMPEEVSAMGNRVVAEYTNLRRLLAERSKPVV